MMGRLKAFAKKITFGLRNRQIKQADWYPACPVCGHKSLMLSGEDSFADVGRTEDGVIAYWDCAWCGCYVEAWVAFEEEE